MLVEPIAFQIGGSRNEEPFLTSFGGFKQLGLEQEGSKYGFADYLNFR
jgi:acyl-CoA reductase-like NAD-dependent aldehyde dehydrogenase